MLRVTVDINGRKLGEVAAVNATGERSGVNEYELYNVDSVGAGESVVEEGEQIGTLKHRYEDGAATLVQKMMEELDTLPN
jgi:hypothetical protein